MTDKILEAVKALGGDVSNCFGGVYDNEQFIHLDSDGDYMPCRKKFKGAYICAISEFNTYAEQWLKEAYMHNAAIDLGWDTKNVLQQSCLSDNIRHSNGMYAKTMCDDWEYICTDKELADYCEANKPIALAVAGCAGNVVGKEYSDALASINNSSSNTAGEILPPQPGPCPDFVRSEEAPIFTQEMADAGELPPVGSVVEFCKNSGRQHGDVTSKWLHGDALRVISHEPVLGEVLPIVWNIKSESASSVMPDCIKPIKSPREKAIEAIKGSISLRARDGANEVANEVYDWIKQLTPEQRKEFGL